MSLIYDWDARRWVEDEDTPMLPALPAYVQPSAPAAPVAAPVATSPLATPNIDVNDPRYRDKWTQSYKPGESWDNNTGMVTTYEVLQPDGGVNYYDDTGAFQGGYNKAELDAINAREQNAFNMSLLAAAGVATAGAAWGGLWGAGAAAGESALSALVPTSVGSFGPVASVTAGEALAGAGAIGGGGLLSGAGGAGAELLPLVPTSVGSLGPVASVTAGETAAGAGMLSSANSAQEAFRLSEIAAQNAGAAAPAAAESGLYSLGGTGGTVAGTGMTALPGAGLDLAGAGSTVGMTAAPGTGLGFNAGQVAGTVGAGGLLSSGVGGNLGSTLSAVDTGISSTIGAGGFGAFADPSIAGTTLQTLANAGVTPEVLKAAGADSGLMKTITDATGLTAAQIGSVASTGLGMLGSYLQGKSATDAAKTSADAQIEAARIAADAAKFRPVGVTTRFGQSKFGTDAQGNLTSAGYTLTPDIKAQQDKLMGVSNDALSQYQGAQAATAPMGQAAQTMFGLGQGYLLTSPQEQAKKYMAEQRALLGAGRERDMASLQNRLQQQGRMGLSTGGTSTGMMAANPELEAYYNSIRQQDLGLAAKATQGGMDYATYGAGMVGAGGEMLRGMYDTQTAAYKPYQTALGGAQQLEGLGQNSMDLGISIGAKGTDAAARGGLLRAQGMQGAAQTQQATANQVGSPWGNLLQGGANMLSQYSQPQQQARFDPYTGQPIRWGA